MLAFPWRQRTQTFEVLSSFGFSGLPASLLNLNTLFFFTSYFISLLESLACHESKRRYLYPCCENVYSPWQILSVVWSLYIFQSHRQFSNDIVAEATACVFMKLKRLGQYLDLSTMLTFKTY